MIVHKSNRPVGEDLRYALLAKMDRASRFSPSPHRRSLRRNSREGSSPMTSPGPMGVPRSKSAATLRVTILDQSERTR
jgi:hypothetical protein